MKNKKIFLILGIVLNFLALGYYKYSNFFIENFNNLLNINIKYLSIILPLGISFFTFQNVSYLIDVYRGDIEAQKSIVKYGTYITFFPQLIAGPIVRYKDINEEIENRTESFDNFGQGVRRFVLGLSKKVLIANILGELVNVFLVDSDGTVLFYWLYAIANMLQIYFDFSGYSDMAIGLGKMFGFEFLENFNYPYISKSITEFWRRWHISLGSFFRDYVYIPLGGNRKGLKRTYINLFITWGLTGLWHGASWNYIFWGLYFFVFIAMEKAFLSEKLEKNKILATVYSLFIAYFGWVLFKFENTSAMFTVLKGMFLLNKNSFTDFETTSVFLSNIFFIIVACLCATPLFKNVSKFISDRAEENMVVARVWSVITIVSPVVLIFISLINIVGNSYNPFLYFQF